MAVLPQMAQWRAPPSRVRRCLDDALSEPTESLTTSAPPSDSRHAARAKPEPLAIAADQRAGMFLQSGDNVKDEWRFFSPPVEEMDSSFQ
jgi:hypothetical protein